MGGIRELRKSPLSLLSLFFAPQVFPCIGAVPRKASPVQPARTNKQNFVKILLKARKFCKAPVAPSIVCFVKRQAFGTRTRLRLSA